MTLTPHVCTDCYLEMEKPLSLLSSCYQGERLWKECVYKRAIFCIPTCLSFNLKYICIISKWLSIRNETKKVSDLGLMTGGTTKEILSQVMVPTCYHSSFARPECSYAIVSEIHFHEYCLCQISSTTCLSIFK